MKSVLPLVVMLVCTAVSAISSAATVYKSYDASGRVTFSDQPPARAVSVEKLEVLVQPAADPDLYLARMRAMTEVTDKIAAARMERERLRAQTRRESTRAVEYATEEYSPGYYAAYPGYGYSSGLPRRYHRKRHHPSHPIVRPPMHAARGPALVNQYPASLVRRSYSPRVAAVFQNPPVAGTPVAFSP
jgi:hypothetical protein